MHNTTKKAHTIQVFKMLGRINPHDDRLVFLAETVISTLENPELCRTRQIKRLITPVRAHAIRIATIPVYAHNSTATYRPFSTNHAIGWELRWEKPQRRHHGHQ